MFNAQSIEEARRYAEMAESLAGVGYWRMCASTQAVTWSPNMYRIFGFDPAQTPSLSAALARIHPDDRDASEERLKVGLADTPSTTRSRIVLPSGEIRVLESKHGLERDENGNVLNHFGTVADITDYLRTQRDLAANVARWRLVAENASDIIASYGLDGVLTYVSPAAETILGIKPEDLVGRSAYDIVAPEDHAAVKAAFRQLVAGTATAATSKIEYRSRRADGQEIWLEAHPRPIVDDAGNVIEILDVVRDVSARKDIERALLCAKEEAEAAARLKGEFVANITHELRTPLTSILGYSNLIQTPGLDPKELNLYARNIASAGESLLTTVNDVLDFSSLESGAIRFHPTAQSITAVARDVVSLFEAQAAAAGIEVACQVADDVPDQLIFDPLRVKQLMLNLVANALKFTTAGSVLVSVANGDREGHVRIAVRDTGCGIARNAQSRLFKRFSQIDGSATRTRSGTGLGLAIAKGLAESMGGQIGVESEVGAGSTFWFTLPAPRAGDTPSISTDPAYNLAGLRALVVDDHPVIGELVAAMLAREGVEVRVEASGEDGLSAALAAPYDAIFIDLNMPGLSGVELAGRIRLDRCLNQHTPMAALTAASDRQLKAAAPLFDAVVPKPVVGATLLSTLRALTTEPSHIAQ